MPAPGGRAALGLAALAAALGLTLWAGSEGPWSGVERAPGGSRAALASAAATPPGLEAEVRAAGLAERSGGLRSPAELGPRSLASAPTAAAPQAPEAIRAGPEARAGQLLILGPGGAPLAGAELSAHLWDAEVYQTLDDSAGNLVLWHLAERSAALAQRRLAGRSDASGRVALERSFELVDPETDFEFCWVTHPLARAALFQRAVGESWPASLRLEPGRAATARVTLAGAPIAGARLVQQALPPEQIGAGSLAGEALMRRALERRSETDRTGAAALLDLGGPMWVWAEAEGQRSLPVRLGEPGPIELELLPTWSLEALARSLDGSRLAPEALVSIESIGVGDPALAGQPLASMQSPDGVRFGPLELPRLPAGREYLLRLWQGGNREWTARFPAPLGSAWSLEMPFVRGVDLAVFPVALEDGAALAGARVFARPSGGAPGAILERRADADGIALLAGLDAELAYDIEAQAPGRAPRTIVGVRVAPGERRSAFDLPLARAATLSGRVLLDGQPAQDFVLIHSSAVLGQYQRRAFGPEAAGAFLLEDLAEGPLTILAELPGLGLTPPARLELLAASATAHSVELELGPGQRAAGRLLDAQSGAPIAAARLTLLSGDPERPRASMPLPQVSDALGRFELERLHPEASALCIEAPGHRPELVALAWPSEPRGAAPLDFGTIALEPLADLSVRLEGAADPTRYQVALGFRPRGPSVAFDAAGRASLPLDRAAGELSLRHPSGVEDLYALDGSGSDAGEVRLWVDEGRRLELLPTGAGAGGPREALDLSLDAEAAEAPAEPSAALDAGALPAGADADLLDVWIKFTDPEGRPGLRLLTLSDRSRATRVPAIPARVLYLQWSYGAPARSAQASVALSGAELERIELPLGASNWPLRLVDGAGRGLPGVRIEVYQRAPGQALKLLGQRLSDAQGLAQLPSAPAGELCLALQGPEGGVLADVCLTAADFGLAAPAPGPRAQDAGHHALPLWLGEPRLVERVFDPRLTFEFVLRDEDGPLPGARLDWSALDGQLALGSQSSDDSGRARRTALGPGRYRIAIEAPGHWPLEFELDLPAEGLPPLELRLPRRVLFERTLLGADGLPLADQPVLLSVPDLPPGARLIGWPPLDLATDNLGRVGPLEAPSGALAEPR